MLISFSVENFKSFHDRVELRLDATADTDLENVVRHDIPGIPKSFRGMLTVVSIHGANASGKSNLIKAARLLDDLVDFSSNSPDGRFAEDGSPFNPTRSVDPFRLDESSSHLPTHFEIRFLHGGAQWAYGLVLDNTKVYSEWLYHWPNGQPVEIFARGDVIESDKKAWFLDRGDLEESSMSARKVNPEIPTMDPDRWEHGIASEASEDQECWSWGKEFDKGVSEGQALAGRTRIDVPFLSVAAYWNHSQAQHVIGWFSRLAVLDLTVTPHRRSEMTSRTCDADPKVHEWVERWLRAADLGISSIKIEKNDVIARTSDGIQRRRFEARAVHDTPDGRKVAFDMQDESHGTIRLFSMAVVLYRALQLGGVMVVDELHSGLHPLLLRALVKMFQSKEHNPRNAQLIFTTHDVSVLDNTLLRRDQIHIVEKTHDGSSELYSVSNCDDKPRKNAPLIKYYLAGHLGGTPDLDLDILFPNGPTTVEAK